MDQALTTEDTEPTAGPDLPGDLNRDGVKAALAGIAITVDGAAILVNDLIALVRCRGPRFQGDAPYPLDGCRGRGFWLRKKLGGKTDLSICGCALNAWRKAHPAPAVGGGVLSAGRARRVEAVEQVVRSRADRKRGALAEARADLAAILERQGEAIGSLVQDLANADAREAVHRGKAADAAEWVRNCDQRIAEIEKLRAAALEDGRVAFDDECAAHAEGAALRAKIEVAKEANGPRERAARRKIEKLERRVQTFVSYHPEAAAP